MEPQAGRPDIIRELRLRRWAREHFVPAGDRDEAWHPVVLEEMAIRDQERLNSEHRMLAHAFVPLMPSDYPRLHEPHHNLPRTRLLRVPGNSGALPPLETQVNIV